MPPLPCEAPSMLPCIGPLHRYPSRSEPSPPLPPHEVPSVAVPHMCVRGCGGLQPPPLPHEAPSTLPRTAPSAAAHPARSLCHPSASAPHMLGAWVPVNQLAEQEVIAYMQLEEGKISKALDDLLDICKSQKVETRDPFLFIMHKSSLCTFDQLFLSISIVNASKIIVSCDNTARGLLQLVDDHEISDLVMGASSHRGYTSSTHRVASRLTPPRLLRGHCHLRFTLPCAESLPRRMPPLTRLRIGRVPAALLRRKTQETCLCMPGSRKPAAAAP
ncbi:hypothetical protein GUJ93_ZPchr0012g20613 [Zizania palustris]|uniref:Uncharacterized protein n=1 Tax=Zizania palustris TaxID=103762 RepID=A0A8J5WXP2_ZIZPA|nr:hypothetical protein GUJ93_ZPchr0012g20613 [Zizania palustris]